MPLCSQARERVNVVAGVGEIKMELTEPLVKDGKLTVPAALILGRILGAWMRFKATRDTKNLFEALADYERLMKGEYEDVER